MVVVMPSFATLSLMSTNFVSAGVAGVVSAGVGLDDAVCSIDGDGVPVGTGEVAPGSNDPLAAGLFDAVDPTQALSMIAVAATSARRRKLVARTALPFPFSPDPFRFGVAASSNALTIRGLAVCHQAGLDSEAAIAWGARPRCRAEQRWAGPDIDPAAGQVDAVAVALQIGIRLDHVARLDRQGDQDPAAQGANLHVPGQWRHYEGRDRVVAMAPDAGAGVQGGHERAVHVQPDVQGC